MNDQEYRSPEPQTAMELVQLIFRKIPQQLLKSLPLMVIMGLASFLLNFWLLAYVNEGFNPTENWLCANLIAVTGRLFPVTLLWGLGGLALVMLIGFIRQGGKLGKSLRGIFSQPRLIIGSIQQGTNRYNAILCLAVALTLLLEILLSGLAGLLAGSLIMTAAVAFVTGRGSVLIQLIRLAANDVNLVYP